MTLRCLKAEGGGAQNERWVSEKSGYTWAYFPHVLDIVRKEDNKCFQYYILYIQIHF